MSESERESSPSQDHHGYSYGGRIPPGKTLLVPNQHHDEAVDLSDGASSSHSSPEHRNFARSTGASPAPSVQSKSQAETYEDGEDDDDDDDDELHPHPPPTSNPLANSPDPINPNVSAEINDLFNYIGRYIPHEIDLETTLDPFVPDYVPSVGDIDAFIKIPRPDGKPDGLGLVVLDEPCGNQTDPTVLDLQLRVTSKQTSSTTPITVRSIENADKNPKNITAWITNVQELHRQKPPPTVSYSRVMPEIDDLMQVWPIEFETLLSQVDLPGSDIELDLENTARLVCALMDIPVYNSLKESLHLLFSLYIDFKMQNISDDLKNSRPDPMQRIEHIEGQ